MTKEIQKELELITAYLSLEEKKKVKGKKKKN